MGANVRVVIVNYNAGPLLAECVRSVLATPLPLDVVVVDNGSKDDSLKFLGEMSAARFSLIKNATNQGFSKACNQGLHDWQGDFALLLNPDCLIGPDIIPGMLEVMSVAPQYGMAGCLIQNPDGSEQIGCRRLTPTPERVLAQLFGRTRINLSGMPLPEKPVEVEAISGAFMLVRRTACEKVGLLDDGYFMHWEDLDWCYRFRQAGWPILFVPGLSITHVKGACSQRAPIRVEWHKHIGMVRYYEKFFSRRSSIAVRGLIYLGLWGRFALSVPRAVWRSIRAA